MIGLRLSSIRPVGVVLMLAALVSACAGTRGGPIPYGGANLTVPDPVKPPAPDANYVISTGDKLRVTVYQVQDLSRDYEVDPAGNIAMPLIGAVPAVGQRVDQLRSTITARLSERYLRNPDVTISVIESPGRTITVDGSVRLPGRYPATGPMTLMQAVALANGADQNANLRRVAVFRQIGGQRMAAAFDLQSIRRGQATDPEVYAGDIVVVDGNRRGQMIERIFGTLPILALFRPY